MKDVIISGCSDKPKLKQLNEQDFPSSDNEIADNDFHQNKQEAKTDFDKACNLYRRYVMTAEDDEERKRRLNVFRCG